MAMSRVVSDIGALKIGQRRKAPTPWVGSEGRGSIVVEAVLFAEHLELMASSDVTLHRGFTREAGVSVAELSNAALELSFGTDHLRFVIW